MENEEVFEEFTVAPETPVEEPAPKEKQAVKPTHPLSGVALALSIVFCWFAPSAGLVSLAPLIMAIVAMVDSKKKDYAGKGMNITALILSIVAIVLYVLYWVAMIVLTLAYIFLIGYMISMSETPYGAL